MGEFPSFAGGSPRPGWGGGGGNKGSFDGSQRRETTLDLTQNSAGHMGSLHNLEKQLDEEPKEDSNASSKMSLRTRKFCHQRGRLTQDRQIWGRAGETEDTDSTFSIRQWHVDAFSFVKSTLTACSHEQHLSLPETGREIARCNAASAYIKINSKEPSLRKGPTRKLWNKARSSGCALMTTIMKLTSQGGGRQK